MNGLSEPTGNSQCTLAKRFFPSTISSLLSTVLNSSGKLFILFDKFRFQITTQPLNYCFSSNGLIKLHKQNSFCLHKFQKPKNLYSVLQIVSQISGCCVIILLSESHREKARLPLSSITLSFHDQVCEETK